MEEVPTAFPETRAPEMHPMEPSRPEQEEMAAVDWEKKMRPVFDNIDLDKSGTITQAEYVAFLKKSGMQYDAANVNADMDPMDADKDGKITFKEFVNFYKADYEKHHK
ncbi:unnamed protein product [Lampetra planeri]